MRVRIDLTLTEKKVLDDLLAHALQDPEPTPGVDVLLRKIQSKLQSAWSNACRHKK